MTPKVSFLVIIRALFGGVRKKAGPLHAGARPGPASAQRWTKKCIVTHLVHYLRNIRLVIVISDGSVVSGLEQWPPKQSACNPGSVQDSPLGCGKKIFFVPLTKKIK